MHPRTFIIISCLGVVLSIGATVYASISYLALSRSAETILGLAPGRDLVVSKFDAALMDNKDRELILNELKTRHEHSVSLHAALTRVSANSKARALEEILLWIGASIIFSVLLLRCDVLRRCEKPQANRQT